MVLPAQMGGERGGQPAFTVLAFSFKQSFFGRIRIWEESSCSRSLLSQRELVPGLGPGPAISPLCGLGRSHKVSDHSVPSAPLWDRRAAASRGCGEGGRSEVSLLTSFLLLTAAGIQDSLQGKPLDKANAQMAVRPRV